MRQYPRPLGKLINELSKLPGVGGKTAQRLAFHILSMEDKEAEALAHSILEAKQTMRYLFCLRKFDGSGPVQYL